MAYTPGVRISHFSNPNIFYKNAATGATNQADNAKTIINYAPTIAKYRTSVVRQEGAFLSLSSSNLNFGSLSTSDSKNLNVEISNSGTESLTINNISLIGDGYSLTNTTQCLTTLNPFQSCQLEIRFSSTVVGLFTGQIIIFSEQAQNSPATINLSASAVAPAPVLSAVTSLSFSRTNIGSSSNTSFKISNLGTSDLNISNVDLDLNPSGVFAILNNSCVNTSLKPNTSCDISISFTPVQATSYTGSLTVSSNDPKKPSHKVSLTGAGATAKKTGGGKDGGGKGDGGGGPKGGGKK